MEVLFSPFVPLIALPGGGLVPGIPWRLALLRRRARLTRFSRRLVLFGCCAWICCGLYETRMCYWMQTVSAQIRVDLLLAAPLLGGLTLWALVALVKGNRKTAEVADAD
jgi:hypothetical protein